MKILKRKPSKICHCCGQPFCKKRWDSKTHWENRLYCSNRCNRIKIPLHIYTEERLKHLLSKTVVTKSGCIEWQGGLASYRYAQITILGVPKYLHRFVWETLKGPIPEGFNVLHKCDNTKCCNIQHLFLGTQLDNIKDRDQKKHQANAKSCHNGLILYKELKIC